MADKMLEGAFYAYMYSMAQADPEWNRYVLQFYVPYFTQCQHVLDVGCGEGQFIELLRARGVKASGVDSDSQMVKTCQAKGLDVVEADLFDYLGEQKGQFDGVFNSNVLEHFSIQDALRFLRVAFDTLRPGGILLVATPNPESLIVHLHEFWRDATHVRLYNRFLLEFLLSWAGFCNIQGGENPRTIWTPPAELQEVPKLLGNLPSGERFSQMGAGTVFEPQGRPKVAGRERPLWRRLLFPLRRRLAQFLTRTILFEEFALLNDRLIAVSEHATALEAMSTAMQKVGHALYQSQSNLLAVPREIFAKGATPVGPEPG